jgi:peptidoglycan/LPS O-acetylase OafA/YrhL
MLYAGYGGLLLYCMKRIDGKGRVVGALAKIGAYSYTIYLCHLPVALWSVSSKWSPTSLHWGRDAVFFTYMAVSLIAGIALATVVERPALRLREKLLPSTPRQQIQRTAPAAPESAARAEEMCEIAIPSGL